MKVNSPLPVTDENMAWRSPNMPIIMFIWLTHEYMVKMINKREHLNCCADTADDGVIVWGDTSPISGRVKMGSSPNVSDHL